MSKGDPSNPAWIGYIDIVILGTTLDMSEKELAVGHPNPILSPFRYLKHFSICKIGDKLRSDIYNLRMEGKGYFYTSDDIPLSVMSDYAKRLLLFKYKNYNLIHKYIKFYYPEDGLTLVDHGLCTHIDQYFN